MCKILKLMDIQDNTNAYNLKDFACSVDIAEKEETDNSHLKKYGSGLEYLEERIKILQDTADSIIKNAEEEAKKIVEKTNQEAVAILSSSIVEGYKRGLVLANKKTEELLNAAKREAEEIIESTKERTEEIINSQEEGIVNLSFDIAKKILDVEIDRNDKVFCAIIKKALEKFSAETDAKITMAYDDLSRLDTSLTGGSNIKFTGDKNMKKGDILIETEKGTIDASVNSQFGKLKSALVGQRLNAV